MEPLFNSVGDFCRAIIHGDTDELADRIRTWCSTPLERTEVREGLTALSMKLLGDD